MTLAASFKTDPYWWEAAAPRDFSDVDVPVSASVAIIGGGYAGLSTALELRKRGVDVVLFDKGPAGIGASTRNAGFVASYSNLSQRYGGLRHKADEAAERRAHAEALESADLVVRLSEEEGIDCAWQKTGSFLPAWSLSHFKAMPKKVEHLNKYGWDAGLVSPSEVATELGSSFYPAGMTIGNVALIHPARLYDGLLSAVLKRGAMFCSHAEVLSIARNGAGWRLRTARGTVTAGQVVVATNGYTGDLTPEFKRRIVSVGSYIIATEELPEAMMAGLIPKGRGVIDTKRVLSFCRPSPDRRRLLFGGRVRFDLSGPEETAIPLHRAMIERFPQLDGCRITHAWTGNVAFTFDERPHLGTLDGLHYVLGCNGTGIAMMIHLGTLMGKRLGGNALVETSFGAGHPPTHPLYRGNPWFIPIVGKYFQFRDWIDRRS